MDNVTLEDFLANSGSLLPQALPQRAPQGMRKFTVTRVNDQSGVSGTGTIAQGVVFATGECVIQWLHPLPNGDIQIKTGGLEQWLKVHVYPHPDNITIVTFECGEMIVYPEPAKEKEITAENTIDPDDLQ